ncbi:MAG TPA: exodeoxyribonuclease VII small subunit [Candidatus Eisenbacteria bacterium]|nr:exodeoxyribonuclease VII small subunit [Candidatus Eisenbacteria bacterium]
MRASRKQPAADAAPAAGGGGADEPSFEQAMERLETIVEELEGGSLTLDESLARYEEGMKLSKRLTQSLDRAEKRIERLVEEEGSTPATRPLETDFSSDARMAGNDEGELPF